jgi:hypothetical protein
VQQKQLRRRRRRWGFLSRGYVFSSEESFLLPVVGRGNNQLSSSYCPVKKLRSVAAAAVVVVVQLTCWIENNSSSLPSV